MQFPLEATKGLAQDALSRYLVTGAMKRPAFLIAGGRKKKRLVAKCWHYEPTFLAWGGIFVLGLIVIVFDGPSLVCYILVWALANIFSISWWHVLSAATCNTK